MEGYIDDIEPTSYVDVMNRLKGEAKKYARRLFEEKVGIPTYEYRELNEEEAKELKEILREYDADLGTNATELLGEKFTVISPSRG